MKEKLLLTHTLQVLPQEGRESHVLSGDQQVWILFIDSSNLSALCSVSNPDTKISALPNLQPFQSKLVICSSPLPVFFFRVELFQV